MNTTAIAAWVQSTLQRVQPSLSPQFVTRFSTTLSRTLLALALGLSVVISVLSIDLSGGRHWVGIFQPAARRLMTGESPYGPDWLFFNPPWALIPLVPLALLPAVIGQIVMAVACCASLYYVARRLSASPLVSAIVVLLPQAISMYGFVNLDWMVALGMLMPAPIGLLFVLVKPHLGVGIAAYWMAEAWRRERLKGLLRTSAPLAVAGLISVLLYGPWFSTTDPAQMIANRGLTLWPWTVPLGLYFIVRALRRQDPGLALFGGALLSPYMGWYSWVVAVLGLLRPTRRALLILAVLALIGLQYG